MKKEYIKPQSCLHSVKFDENIASSQGDDIGGDMVSGSMTILFTHAQTPCRDWYTKGVGVAKNSVGEVGSFVEYFNDMQLVNAPIACLQLI